MITLCASLLHKSTLKKGLGSQGIDKEAQEEHAGGDEQPVQTLLGAALRSASEPQHGHFWSRT